MNQRAKNFWQHSSIHAILLVYSFIALFPTLLVLMNSFKARLAIFDAPYAPPTPATFDPIGYQTVFSSARFDQYFLNSLIVTLVSLALILIVSAMAAHALAEYEFRGSTLLSLYLSIGTLTALILVYVASGIPLAVFVLTQFFQAVPRELKDAGRIDGASEYRIFALILPIVRPALGTVAIFNMIPIWNDLWFPLILANQEGTKTVILGAQIFLGQFVNDWNAVLAALTLAVLPVMVLYVIFSRQLIRGLTQGAVK
jgi:raffinose/stachyose/melibiose transport system permease protein